MQGLIDTHTHLFLEEFDEDRELVLSRAKEAGVDGMFMPNIDDTSINALLSLCNTHENCFPLIGFHPTSVDGHWKERLSVVERWLRSAQPFYGIGEAGLDFYWDDTYKKEQIEVLEKQIEWALEFDLPLILHCRKAYPELISVLSAYKRTTLYGIFHSFTGGDGDSIFLPELLDFSSFMLGINGVVTFKKSVLPELLQNNIPLGRVVLETDSPYLSPVPYRGKRNESAYVAKVAEKLSEIYGEAPEKIVQTTLQNALTIFRKAKMYF